MSTTSPTLVGTPRLRRLLADRLSISRSTVTRYTSNACLIAILFMCASVVGLALYGYSHSDRYYEGISVAGVPLGGMTRAEARIAIEEQFDSYLRTTLVLTSRDQQFSLAADDAGVALNVDATVSSSFTYGRQGSWWARTRAWAGAVVHGRDLPLAVEVDQSRLDGVLAALAPGVTRPPVNASIALNAPGGPEIVPDQAGVALDVTSTRMAVVNRFRGLSSAPVELVTPVVPAAIGAADLQSSLAAAQGVTETSFVISGLDRHWGVSANDVTRIVSVGPNGVVSVDERAVELLIRDISAEIELPSRNAAVMVRDGERIVVRSGRDAIEVDARPSSEAVIAALAAGQHQALLVVDRRSPAIGNAAAEAAVQQAEAMVAEGVHLTWDGAEFNLGRGDLLAALTVESDSDADQPFVFGFDREILAELLTPIAGQIDAPAANASFRLVGSKVTVVSKSRTGYRLDVDTAVEAIVAAIDDGTRRVTLTVQTEKPAYTDGLAKKIRLPDLLAESATYYGESSDARRHNVEQATKLETGWLVPPGGQFSYVQYVGDVSEKEGFVTGFGIVASPEGDGKVTTAPVIGGGICQVSTTMFQAAFWAGLQIDERYEHPYWMQTYGEPPRGMRGLDAMVNIEDEGSLDMRFTNTTGDWIAVVVVADGQFVRAEIRGTATGWNIQVDQPVISDVVQPDSQTFFTESPELPAGQEMQVEHAQEGFTATVHRRVTDANGQVIDELSLTSIYGASRNTILRGTGPAES